MRKTRIIAAALALLFATLYSTTAHSSAATKATPPAQTAQPGSGQALEIAPPVIYLTADPGQTLKTQIYLRDIAATNLIVSGEANDFVANGENGAPKVILNNDTNNPYSMKSWVVPPANLLLVPREVKTMSLTINVPSTASPGGHYGIIRFTGTPPELQGAGVSLNASLGALILLTVNGKITNSLSVKEFSVNHGGKSGTLFESGPLNFVERLQNTGNVHEQPAGLVTITDMFGKKIATLPINEPPRNILPASIRRFEEPLDKTVIGNKRLFGKYTAKLDLTYGGNKKLSSSIVFWVIPYKLIAIIIIVLIIGFFALRYSLRRYNAHIVSKAHGRKR